MTGVVVAGDPASCSQTGGALRRLAARLRVAPRPARRAADALADPAAGARGPVPRQARRRVDALDAATSTLANELDAVGSALQVHATDLAEAIARARGVVARAEGSGLRVTSGVVAPAWGVTGLADPDLSAARVSAAVDLQAELDQVLAVVSRRRARLVDVLSSSGARLSAHSVELRR
jgi:hypothetical protein